MNKLVQIVAIGMSCFIVGCKAIQINGYQKDPVGRTSDIYHGCLYDGVFWNGYLWECDWVSGKSQTNTLYSVRIEPNYIYSLVTVMSLGVYAPVEVSWQFNSDDPAGIGTEKDVNQ